mmetsp:Transcript_13166/g.19366  ORF Transcript_13166/g.19366 Transcript_13166/m.19366 type:complete len:90 (-) Transcript_13166:150-419(-)
MGFLSGLFGAGVGFSTAMMANAVKKVPLSREPWNHVLFGIVGFWAGAKYPSFEKRMIYEINEARADKGLPPLVGTFNYFQYKDDGNVDM